MRYLSTRNDHITASFEDVVLNGLSSDGGLYVPEFFPRLDISSLHNADYHTIAFDVMKHFTDIPSDDLKYLIAKTYTEQAFSHPDITPLVGARAGKYFLELFHGPTLAFKDLALQFLGNLFEYYTAKNNRPMIVLGATSGDTGSAAIEACRGRKGMKIFILHPHEKTSDMQRRQMTCVEDENVFNIALQGTFDDCQAIVKQLFQQENAHYIAVNSINWARIMAQIVYYVAAALRLPNADFVVPTGNFGNVYAGYVARRMGAPIRNLVIASNRNDILTRTYHTGVMRRDQVAPSLSPSMDIQISSNFERYLYEAGGRDSKRLALMMQEFRDHNTVTLSDAMHHHFQNDFIAQSANDEETLAAMRNVYDQTGIIIDPHTAVGVAAASKLEFADHPLIHLACAHPAKFEETVMRALGVTPPLPKHFESLKEKRERFVILPNKSDSVAEYIQAQGA